MVLSTAAAGTISHTARGFLSFFTRSASEADPIAFSLTNSPTIFGDRSNTTQSCPFLIRRRAMLAPILPSPTIPSCISAPLQNRSTHCQVVSRGPQRLHGGANSVVCGEYRRPGHEHVRSRCHYQRGSRFINASVHFEVTFRFELVDHAAHPANLGQGRLKEMLMSEARIDGHNQHLVHIWQNFLQHSRGRGRVNDNPGS